MFIILFILFIGIPLIKEEIENQAHREECRRRGYETYWSTDGLRRVDNNKKVYKQHTVTQTYHYKVTVFHEEASFTEEKKQQGTLPAAFVIHFSAIPP